jgi:hypothetical protein
MNMQKKQRTVKKTKDPSLRKDSSPGPDEEWLRGSVPNGREEDAKEDPGKNERDMSKPGTKKK